ncbi:type VI secretion system Vgr family protein [Herbaspirillum robiniae]|uniref:type VI secretion system Vgr family protein n=1 Tax=Herbaspirillum robiniae TaxID=2014887 RepID=UPI003D772F13
MASLSNRLQANKRFEFSSKAFDADKFAVVDMEGFESVSKTFRFTLTLVTDDAAVDFDKMLQNPASFTIFAPDGGASTPYHGVLAGFDQLHRSDGYVFYRAVLVPRLWRLSLYRISEVYLNEQTIPAILEGVLKGVRLPASAFELKLMGDYRPRSFVCQYQEAHLDFLSRWMEKEGMYYWFDHAGAEDKLVVADNRMMHAADAVKVNYRPADELDTGVAPDAVQGFVCRQKPLPHQVILQDFNHRKASVELKASEVVYENGFGDVMIYGENFRNEQEGKRYAKLRAEEIACGGKVFAGDSTAVGLRSGFFMELAHHYREDFNGKYLVTEIRHEGSQAGALLEGIRSPYSRQGAGGETNYRNSFTAIPAAVQFRAERVTPKPRVAGTMNATIDGEGSGEYAELDEYGQYKVQLPFDQSDKNANKGSARVRMATPYSGSNHGMHFPLHKNAEVLLSFVDGDPDQPVIMGAVPNSENLSLVNINSATENRISTKGGNQMHMSDVKGKEVIWLNSPFHHSSIGIGSIDPRGGGSIFTATKGSSDSVSFGNSNSMSFGPKNSLSLGTATSLDMSFANKVTMGASIGISMANDIKWNMNLNPFASTWGLQNVSIDDTDSVKFDSTNGSQSALESYTISAGHSTFDPKVLDIKFTQKVLRGLIAAFTTFNLAGSTVFSMYANGQLKSVDSLTEVETRRNAAKAARDAEKTKKLADLDTEYANKTSDAEKAEKKTKADAINKEYADKDKVDASGMEDPNFVGGWKGVIVKCGTDAVANVLAMMGIQGYARNLATKLKAMKDDLISKIKLDKTGIEMKVDFPITDGGGGNALTMNSTGITAEATGAAAAAKMTLKSSGEAEIQLSFAKKFHMDATKAEIVFQNQSLNMTSSDATLQASGGASALKLDSASAKMSTATSSVSAAANEAKMAVGASSVTVSTGGVNLAAAGGKTEIGPTGVSLNGAMIHIG